MLEDWLKFAPAPKNSALFLSLQHFAAEDEGRTEEPTEQKIRKAREEGRVAKSPEVASSAVLILALVCLALVGPWMARTIGVMVQYFIHQVGAAADKNHTGQVDGAMANAFYNYYFKLCGPIFLISFFAAFAGMAAQVGFNFTTKPLKADFKKITPNFGKYVQKTIASPEALYNLAKSLFKVFLIGIMAYITIRGAIFKIISAPFSPLADAARFIWGRAFLMMGITAIFLFALAIIDYFFQKRQFTESIKMSKQEVKDELKDSEGNPIVKSRMRSRMMSMMRATMMQNVPKADVIIANPTHFAVALEYTPGTVAPKVTAKGQDLMALRIKEKAKEAGVPIVENKPLARGLYAAVDIGQEIPPEYWEVTATILGQVYSLSRKKTRLV